MADFEDDDNPFADKGDTADDFNPFDDSMFDKKPKATEPAPAAKTEAVPDWATESADKTDFIAEAAAAPKPARVQTKNKKAVTEQPVAATPPPKQTYSPVLSPDSPDPNVPDWAQEQPAVKGTHYGTGDVKEPLLGPGGTGSAAGGGGGGGHQFVSIDMGSSGLCLAAKPYDAARVPNWPPFPARCPWPFKPCFYQHFGEPEIPNIWRVSIKGMFSLWCFYVFTLFWNLIARLAALDCNQCDTTVTGMFLALAFFVFMGPCAYYWWFRTLYNAARSDSTLKYGCFFCTFTIQIGVCIFFAIGPPGMGAAGIWTASIATQHNQEVSFLMFAAAIMWVILSIANIIGVQKVLMTFRTSGLAENAVQRAQQEAAAGAGQAAYQVAQTDAGKKAIVGAATGAYGSNA